MTESRFPGGRLRAIARLVFDADTLTRVVEPTLADMHHEIASAQGDAERRAAARRGYVAFWKLVLMSPFVFGDWPGRRQFARSVTLVGATLGLALVALSAESRWLTGRLLTWWPGLVDRIASVGDIAPWAWMLAPILLMFFGLWTRRSPFRTAPLSVLLIAGATTIAAVSYGAAAMVATMSGIGSVGYVVSGARVGVIDAVSIPTLLAIGVMLVFALGVAFSQWRLGRARPSTTPGAAPASLSPLLLVAAVVVSLLVVDYWLRLNEGLLETMSLLMAPGGPPPGTLIRDLVGRTEVAFPLVILGWLLAAGMVVAGLAAWRTSTTSLAQPLTKWTIRVAVAVVLIGGVWHGSAITQHLQAFRQTIPRAQAR